jgi:HD-GYP domain-containing protein (c-di-GMP phosphodiesterase class II)
MPFVPDSPGDTIAPTVSMRIDNLLTGHRLTHPIHSQDGLLLIAADVVLTAELRDNLLARGLHEVLVGEEDAQQITGSLPVAESGPSEWDQAALDARAEEFVRQNHLHVGNHGPAVAAKVRQMGTCPYSPKHQAATVKNCHQGMSSVSSFMTDVAKGVHPNVNDVTGASIDLLTADFAGMLATTFNASKQPTLMAHSIKMANLAMALAIEMHLDENNVHTIGIAAMLADLGMIYVPERLLRLQRRLRPIERLEVQKHSIYTADLLSRLKDLPSIVSVITYQVHEKPDGSGYPRQRMGNSIHPFARILHVADAYSAMTSDRPDRPRMMPYSAVECLLRQANNNQVDAAVVRALLRCVSLFPIGSQVVLSDGTQGIVLRANDNESTKPVVQRLVAASDGSLQPSGDVVDLRNSSVAVMKAVPAPNSKELAIDVRSGIALAHAC